MYRGYWSMGYWGTGYWDIGVRGIGIWGGGSMGMGLWGHARDPFVGEHLYGVCINDMIEQLTRLLTYSVCEDRCMRNGRSPRTLSKAGASSAAQSCHQGMGPAHDKDATSIHQAASSSAQRHHWTTESGGREFLNLEHDHAPSLMDDFFLLVTFFVHNKQKTLSSMFDWDYALAVLVHSAHCRGIWRDCESTTTLQHTGPFTSGTQRQGRRVRHDGGRKHNPTVYNRHSRIHRYPSMCNFSNNDNVENYAKGVRCNASTSEAKTKLK